MSEHSEQHKKLEEEIFKFLSSKKVQSNLQQVREKAIIIESLIILLDKNQTIMSQSTPNIVKNFTTDMLANTLTNWASMVTLCGCNSCAENTANLARSLVTLGYTLAMEKDNINIIANQWSETKLHKDMMAGLDRDIAGN